MRIKKVLDGLHNILSPKTLKSIKFVYEVYRFIEIKHNEKFQENVRKKFNRICIQKNYTPNKEIFLSKKLIDDILEIDYEMFHEEMDDGSDSSGIKRTDEKSLEKIWQKICEKHSGGINTRIILNEKFVNYVLETDETIYFDEFQAEMDRLEQNLPPRKKETKEEKVISLKKALTSKRNSFGDVFGIYFELAKLMKRKKDYDSTLNYLASALSSLSPIFKNGKPVVREFGSLCLDITVGTDWCNGEYVFELIIDAFSGLAKIQGKGNPKTVKEIIKLGSSFIDTFSSWMLSVPDYRRIK